MAQLRKIFAFTAASAALAGTAAAQMDYHGFDPETVDALNERILEPLKSEQLEILAPHRGIEACGGTSSVDMLVPDGWDVRAAAANPVGGDVAMPYPTTAFAPEFPPLYSTLGVEGACETIFSVNADGKTEDILAKCTLPKFALAATNALEALEFEPADGKDTAETPDILLPMNFCLDEPSDG
ncbi:hypothetical protein D1224_08800 [Henriciella barbarensis]|uniref:TonB C-terminal domain-containing protein n=1 Tax=Henriciella barbarensis TaxID=86342 RepID=A0A399R1G6_9PROT|nr:hypothetical protein [Henriciella barbarensis]RIJ24324.1 hypothetical protein D1224_08800 [Henriciella barbarensis]